MKVIADTNVLLRIALEDDPHQTRAAQIALSQANVIVVTLPTLCEFAWVLSRGYRQSRDEIHRAIQRLLTIGTVRLERPAVNAGLLAMTNGGDFADGVIAHEGRRLGGDIYLTFDVAAARAMRREGVEVRLLSGTGFHEETPTAP